MQPLDQGARWVERQREWQSLKLSHPILTPGKAPAAARAGLTLGSDFRLIFVALRVESHLPSCLEAKALWVLGTSQVGRSRNAVQECCGLSGGAETSLRAETKTRHRQCPQTSVGSACPVREGIIHPCSASASEPTPPGTTLTLFHMNSP